MIYKVQLMVKTLIHHTKKWCKLNKEWLRFITIIFFRLIILYFGIVYTLQALGLVLDLYLDLDLDISTLIFLTIIVVIVKIFIYSKMFITYISNAYFILDQLVDTDIFITVGQSIDILGSLYYI